jgi:hypothetical protein
MSVIRLQVAPATGATPNGVRYRTNYSSGGNVTQFKEGARKFGSSAEGTLIEADDPTMGEVVLSANETILTPNTKEQSLYIGYNSNSEELATLRQRLSELGLKDLTDMTRLEHLNVPEAGSGLATGKKDVNYYHGGIFNATFYANKYADLKRAYGTNATNLKNHWNNYGMKEGRQASPAFDVQWFVNNNESVKNAVGTDYKAAIDYFFQNADAQRLQTSSEFNVNYYSANYKDLRDAYGSDLLAYYAHYVNYGYSEGRVADRLLNDNSGFQTSNADGAIWVNDARTGDAYRVTVTSPEGYYTEWTNMSGDVDNDGSIDSGVKGTRSDREKSDNPSSIYGDTATLRSTLTICAITTRSTRPTFPTLRESWRVRFCAKTIRSSA